MWDKNGGVRAGSIAHAAELCRDLASRYSISADRVLRHYDVTGKNCPAPMVEDPDLWTDFKEAVFMSEKDIPSSWAKESWEKAVEQGVFDGSRPQDALTREQAAVVLDRLGLLD